MAPRSRRRRWRYVKGLQWSGAVTLDNPAAAGFGMYRAVATVTDAQGGALSAQVETLISRAPEPVPGPRADSPFGAHIRLQGPDLSAAAKLGYKWLRIHDASGITKWGIAEPAPGKWVWEDEQVALARKNGFSILGMLDGSPAWESGVEDSGYFSIYGAPRNVENWRNYVREMTGHYAGRIDAWEVWNEPWDVGRFFQGGTPLYYRELLEIAYTEAKLRNPACTIVGVDTYPPIWEKMVLSSGAYPFYDVLSWHRYDPNLHAWPGDAIARVADRINTEQAKHGTPKPLMCSEGGPDVGRFHGSFFSFADPAVVGDWSRGVDQFARMYLSMIAAGNQRFFAYTLHTDPRHGQRIQALTEPGIVLKPMHLGLAALAHFVEGARYVERLRPCADISAHVFAQGETRPYAASPSTVVVLHADGEAAEALPVALPATARAFDRWGNAMVLPTHATRGLGFLVAEGDAGAALLAALRGDAGAVAPLARTQRLPAVDALVDTWLAACASGAPLWPFFSTQGAAAVISLPHRAVVADRAQLREDAGVAEAFSALAGFSRGTAALREAGPFAVGVVELRRADGAAFPMAISVAFDGPGGAPRFLSMAAQLAPADTAAAGDAEAMVRKWETVFKEGTTTVLRDVFRAGVSLLAVSTANGEYFVFDTPDYLRTMLDTAVMWGKAIRSAMSFEAVHVDANTAMLYGEWDLASLSLGAGRNPFTATLLRGPEGWRFVSLTFGAPVM
jgi:hypothetical protein